MSETVPARITLFLPDLRPGGAERVMLQLAGGFVDAGHEVDLVVVHVIGALVNEIPPGVRLVNLNARNEYTCLPSLLRYLRQNDPRALLSTMILANWVVLLAVRLAGCQTRVVLRAATTLSRQWRSSVFKKRLEQVLVHLLYPHSDGIVAVSQGVAQDLASYAGVPSSHIRVIPNPLISEALIQRSFQPLPPGVELSASSPLILSAGRLEPEKDFPTLLRAFAALRRQRPARLIILGEGKERQTLETLIESLGISGEVQLPGYVPNPLAYMRKARAFVLSSTWEGLPNVLIEAMACGCPVISTDCPSGPSEILNGGQYGHLRPVGDVQGIADAIQSVLDGEKRLPPPEWLEQYQVDRVVRQYLDTLGL